LGGSVLEVVVVVTGHASKTENTNPTHMAQISLSLSLSHTHTHTHSHWFLVFGEQNQSDVKICAKNSTISTCKNVPNLQKKSFKRNQNPLRY